MNNATTIIIAAAVCLFICTILIYKINSKYNKQSTKKEKPKQQTQTKNVMVKPSQLPTVNNRGVPSSLFIGDGLPPFLFGRMYKPNQRKIRKHKRQNQCI